MANFIVTTLSDAAAHSGLSLRDALALANRDASADTIQFAAGLAGTISLAQGQLRISSDVTIIGDTNGDRKADITISGNDSNRVLSVESGTSSIESLTLRDGTATKGGAVLVAQGAALSIDYSRITSSQTVATTGDGSRGGGIANLGTLHILNSTIDQNSAYNHGGGIHNGGTLTITNSTLSGNSARGIGGGVLSDGGPMTATNLTVANNRAAQGGGIVNEFVFTGRNLTVTGNTGDGYGNGVFNTGSASLSNSIILGNGESPSAELFGRISAFGRNIVGTGNDTNGSDGVVTADSRAAVFGGFALADNGGPVQTIRLANGDNPAVNAASGGNIPATDARGLFRNGVADLGALEKDGLFAAPTVPVSNTIKGTAGSERIVGTVGNDVIFALSGEDLATGGIGDDKIYGNYGADRLFGSSGNDFLSGGYGDDILVGGAGSDTFHFNNLISIDQITDFNPVDDTISLTKFAFSGLQSGDLASSAFVVASRALDALDRVIYNKATGALSFDRDGTGSHAAVVFAELKPGLSLTADDFLIL
jgi:Ca2+-binding RTX toxin-like protein